MRQTVKIKIDTKKEYGIVLEGGGARGAYQVGAWKALKEAGIKIKGIAGTSVGALNGALMCMDDLEKAEEIWGTMAYSKVLQVEDAMIESLRKLDVKSLNLADMAAEARRVFTDKGLDIGPLKKLIADTIDEEKIRKSDREFFATTFSVTDRKEVNFDVKTAPDGTMRDMLLASAYFPGFKNEKLGGKTYMDGGSINNVPINVLTDRGYKDIIVIRIYGIGLDRERLFSIPEDVNLYRIAPGKNLGGILEFDEVKTRRNMTLGYYDAKRLLYGLEGRKYYLDMPYSEAYYFDKLMSELELLKLYLEPHMAKADLEKLSGYRVYTEKIFPALAKSLRLKETWDYRTFYGAVMELCAKKMGLEVFKIYKTDEILDLARKALAEKRKLGDMSDGRK